MENCNTLNYLMNSRLNNNQKFVSPPSSRGFGVVVSGFNRRRVSMMKSWRQKVSNNEKRKKINSTSYSITTTTTTLGSCNRKITKRRKRISFGLDSIRLLSPLQLLKVKQLDETFSLECEEDVTGSALNTFHNHMPTPSNHVEQELVNGHSNISPSLNESETTCPILSLAQDSLRGCREESCVTTRREETENNLPFCPHQRRMAVDETMDESETICLSSQDNVEETNIDISFLDTVMEDDGQSFHIQVSDSFQLLSDNISRELFNSPTADYLSKHPRIKPHHRRTLVDWFNGLCSDLQLSNKGNEIFYHAVSILDRSLHKFNIEKYYLIDSNNLQALGCACFLLSVKYHGESVKLQEMLPPFLYKELREEIIKMESCILNSLDFELRSILMIDYISLFIYLLKNDQSFVQAFPDLEKYECFIERMEMVSNYLCEIQVHNYDMLWFRPSLVALSCFLLTFQLIAPQSNFKSVPIFREFIKIYLRDIVSTTVSHTNLVSDPVSNVDSNSDQEKDKILNLEIEELNNCIKRCFISMQGFEQLNLKQVNSNRDPFFTITKYQATISRFVNQPDELIHLSIQDYQRWMNEY